MIARNVSSWILKRSAESPVVTITGPRQAGKTTLVREVFAHLPYASLERPDVRDEATKDPLGFLRRHPEGAVLDEIQRAPELLSYIQTTVDEHQIPGEFILTGSQQLGLLQSVTQSLAGRTALATLLPCSHDELARFPQLSGENKGPSIDTLLIKGGYPRIYDRRLEATDWLRDYVETYVERDVRQVVNVGDLNTFRLFMRLCAGRTAQVVNLSALAADAGITHNTARAWLSVLEACYVVFRLPPYHRNLNKRLVRAPKLHFYDTGVVCALLGIASTDVLQNHPLRGSVVETWVVSEILKSRLGQGRVSGLCYFRDTRGREVDLIVEQDACLTAVEIKAGQTFATDFFGGLKYFAGLAARDPIVRDIRKVVVFGGSGVQRRTDGDVLGWDAVAAEKW